MRGLDRGRLGLGEACVQEFVHVLDPLGLRSFQGLGDAATGSKTQSENADAEKAGAEPEEHADDACESFDIHV
jgi:hypothetical protein